MRQSLSKIASLLATILTILYLVSRNHPPKGPKLPSPIEDVPRYKNEVALIGKKCRETAPAWMHSRIDKELKPFRLNKITLRALDVTYEQFIKVASRGTRYRFIDGTVYRKGPDPFGMDVFFCILANYAEFPGIPDLPNIDIIWNHDDATPLAFQSHDFWITKQFEEQAPIFTYAVKKDCPYLISVPDRFTIPSWKELSALILRANDSYSWDNKQKKAFWRGQCNDFARLGPDPTDYATTLQNYSQLARYQIGYLSSLFPETIDAGFSGFGFAHTPMLEEIASPFFKAGVPPEKHLDFAYLPVLDGYTSTYPGYLWRLLSNCVAFKQDSEDSQWFYDALEPYVHYVPIQNQMKDLIEKINWARENDDLCQQIARTATEFVLKNLMIEDIYMYFFLLFGEYERCLSFNTSDLLEETELDPEWIKVTHAEDRF